MFNPLNFYEYDICVLMEGNIEFFFFFSFNMDTFKTYFSNRDNLKLYFQILLDSLTLCYSLFLSYYYYIMHFVRHRQFYVILLNN